MGLPQPGLWRSCGQGCPLERGRRGNLYAFLHPPPTASCFPLDKIDTHEKVIPPSFWNMSHGRSAAPKKSYPTPSSMGISSQYTSVRRRQRLCTCGWLVGGDWETGRQERPPTPEVTYEMRPVVEYVQSPSCHSQQHSETEEMSLELVRVQRDEEGNTGLLRKRLPAAGNLSYVRVPQFEILSLKKSGSSMTLK